MGMFCCAVFRSLLLSCNLVFVSDSPPVVNKQLGAMSLDEQQGA